MLIRILGIVGIFIYGSLAATTSQDLMLLQQQLGALAQKVRVAPLEQPKAAAPKAPAKATHPEEKETEAERLFREHQERLGKVDDEELAKALRESEAAAQVPPKPKAPAKQAAPEEKKKKAEANFTIEGAVAIQPLRAKIQDTAETGLADCGFHSIKNGMILLDWGTGKINDFVRNRRLMADASKIIEELRTLSREKTFAGDESLRAIIKAKNLNDHFLVIPNVSQMLPNLISQNPVEDYSTGYVSGIGYAIEDLQKSEQAVYAFILGNAKFEGGQGVAGHYITVLVRKNRKHLELYLVDSFTEDNAAGQQMNAEGEKMANALIRIIREAKNLEALKQLFGKND